MLEARMPFGHRTKASKAVVEFTQGIPDVAAMSREEFGQVGR